MIAIATAVSAALTPIANKAKKKAFQFLGKEVSVEYGEVDVYRIQYQFYTDEHGQ